MKLFNCVKVKNTISKFQSFVTYFVYNSDLLQVKLNK